MCMNVQPQVIKKQPMFVRQMQGAGSSRDGAVQSYVNVNDIAELRQLGDNYWEAESKGQLKNTDGTAKTYHFDNQGATQIINYFA